MLLDLWPHNHYWGHVNYHQCTSKGNGVIVQKRLKVKILYFTLTFDLKINRVPYKVMVNISLKYHHCTSKGKGVVVQNKLFHRQQTHRQPWRNLYKYNPNHTCPQPREWGEKKDRPTGVYLASLHPGDGHIPTVGERRNNQLGYTWQDRIQVYVHCIMYSQSLEHNEINEVSFSQIYI